MTFPDFTITKDPPKKGSRYAAKGRQFTVTLLGYLCADSMWELGNAKTRRPVWIAYAGADQACRAFTANFRAGRKAKALGEHFQVPKSSPHRWAVERRGEVAVTVAYLPDVFDLEPAVHPNHITFAFMPPRWWIDRQAEAVRAEFGTDSEDIARAALFAAFLDRRSPLPMVHDLWFQLELYRAATEEPWTTTPDGYDYEGLTACGLDSPLFCHVTHRVFEEFLKRRTNAYFAEEIRHGKNRFRPDRRLLPVRATARPSRRCESGGPRVPARASPACASSPTSWRPVAHGRSPIVSSAVTSRFAATPFTSTGSQTKPRPPSSISTRPTTTTLATVGSSTSSFGGSPRRFIRVRASSCT